ncbi:MAG: response regulator transcription factor [Rhodocyclaceae bacterium]|nr:response regulator transcription factor [Rhodocyclaceae bacterium]
MKVLIADDEPHLLAHLKARLAAGWPELQVVAEAANGPEALRLAEETNPDVAFLDIRMPGLSGLEVAARLAETRPACRVVFVTAYEEHAVEAFEQAAVDYLLKPVGDDRLARTVGRLRAAAPGAGPGGGEGAEAAVTLPADVLRELRRLMDGASGKDRLRWIRASVGASVKMIPVEEVCYFQAADKYTAVFTREGEHLIRTPLKDLLAELDPDRFRQVHRGTVVNLAQIASARHDALGRVSLTLRDRPEAVPVSRTYAHLFRQM